MSYQTRKTLFEQIENSRQRPLISYVTSIRPNLSGNMTGDSIDQIIAQIQKIPEDKKEIDFLIISNGGDPITALRIISILRERFNKISVLLAQNIIATAAQNSVAIVAHPPIQLNELIASIESTRYAVAVHTTFSIVYWRDANMALAFNATAYSEGWKSV